MNYLFTTNITEKQHNDFVSNHPYCNLLQSAQWGKVKENWKSQIVAVCNQKKVVASTMVLIKSLPLGFCMMYIPRGPIMDFENKELVLYFFKQLKKWAKKYHCLFIKIDPGILKNRYVLEDKNTEIMESSKIMMDNLQRAGCIHQGFTTSMSETIQPRFHAVVEQCDDFEEQLPKHTKRHIKTAYKKHITVDTYGKEGIPDFVRLMKLTEKRKRIQLRDANYFNHLMDIYQEQSILFLAKIDLVKVLEEDRKRIEKIESDIAKYKKQENGKSKSLLETKNALTKEIEEIGLLIDTGLEKPIIAGALCVFFGSTCEMLYMGMDGQYKRFMPAHVSHLCPMLYSFDHGYTLCNMGGLEGTLDGGLTKFKTNFKPKIYEYMGEFDLPVYSLFYKTSQLAYQLRKKYRMKKADN